MIRFLSLIYFTLLSFPAYAEEAKKTGVKAPVADFSEAKHTKSGQIDKIIDALTIELKDGTIVRLASINTPDFHIHNDAPYSEQALTLLREKLPERTEVLLYQTRDRKKGRVNRMGHELAHLVTKTDNLWMQGLLLQEGLAHVYTAPTDNLMLDDLYKAEQNAQNKKQGLWADDSKHKILSHNETTSSIGDFAVIEGKIEKIATVRNNTYLNFGKNWKTDFTIQISPALRKQFAKEGINILNLAQNKIRVRGYLREYNGPLIELENTAHLEIIKTASNDE